MTVMMDSISFVYIYVSQARALEVALVCRVSVGSKYPWYTSPRRYTYEHKYEQDLTKSFTHIERKREFLSTQYDITHHPYDANPCTSARILYAFPRDWTSSVSESGLRTSETEPLSVAVLLGLCGASLGLKEASPLLMALAVLSDTPTLYLRVLECVYGSSCTVTLCNVMLPATTLSLGSCTARTPDHEFPLASPTVWLADVQQVYLYESTGVSFEA